MKSVAVHNGKYHADDVFAVATLQLIYPDLTVIRTRDPEKLASVEARVDVGRKYNPDTLDFDHHQIEGAGVRENGIPYASFGLIWKHYGLELVDEHTHGYIEKKIVQPIDAEDNGFAIFDQKLEVSPYTVSGMLNNYAPLWNDEQQDLDAAFFEAVAFAKQLLKREFEIGDAKSEAKKYVATLIEETDKPYIVLDKYCPTGSAVRDSDKNLLFTIFPSSEGNWHAKTVTVKSGSFENRKDFPKAWAALEAEELQKVTRVEDAVFCHKTLFLCVAKTKESAIKLVEMALQD